VISKIKEIWANPCNDRVSRGVWGGRKGLTGGGLERESASLGTRGDKRDGPRTEGNEVSRLGTKLHSDGVQDRTCKKKGIKKEITQSWHASKRRH